MKAILKKNKFAEQTQGLEKVAGKQLNLEVLKCIFIECTKKGGVLLRATNLDIGIETHIDGQVAKEGAAAVPATTLSAFLGNADGEDVEFYTDEAVLNIKTPKTNATINTVSCEEFPMLPEVKGGGFDVPIEAFVQGMRSVWYAASTSNMKPELSSIYVAMGDNEIKFVATDSFRLAEKKIHADEMDDLLEILIPLKNAGEIIRNLEKESGTMKLVSNENQASILFGQTHISSRLIDGVFPDYKQIIPSGPKTEVVVLKQDLIQSLKATNVFANKFNQVTFLVEPKKKLFTIKTTGGEAGEGVANPDAAITGEQIELNFNQKYISDSFQAISDDSVKLEFFGAGKPMIIRGASDSSFRYLTMPMNR